MLVSVSSGVYSLFFFFKQKTAYEMRISDWSSDVCSSDLLPVGRLRRHPDRLRRHGQERLRRLPRRLPRPQGRIGTAAVASLERPTGKTTIRAGRLEIGSASCRERVCQYV